ncbi:hypothetical protein Pd630_LPD03910 [Rhodococcus opacus PD630]|nr:hypothetical protein Pd630_LPD03910 [Rhodococcus opacus PD630]
MLRAVRERDAYANLVLPGLCVSGAWTDATPPSPRNWRTAPPAPVGSSTP